MSKSEYTDKIKAEALRLGFDSCGVAKAEVLNEQDVQLTKWLDKGLHADMNYMSANSDKRIDATKLVENAKSVIVVLLNYYPSQIQLDTNAPKVAKYAFGKDYHFVIKDKLRLLLNYINSEIINCNGRFFTDSAPVMERAWAAKAGLGWIGKNTNLIVPHKGSFFFIGELIVDLELDYDNPIAELCGSCTKCLNSCPTNALPVPYTLDSNRCISYQTIENKGEIPLSLNGKFNDFVFGCDICQDVCPWNKFSRPTSEPDFVPKQEFLEMSLEDWQKLDKKSFKRIFNKSALKRTKFEGIARNLLFINKRNK